MCVQQKNEMAPKLRDASVARERSREHAIAAGAARGLTRKRNQQRKRLEVAVEVCIAAQPRCTWSVGVHTRATMTRSLCGIGV